MNNASSMFTFLHRLFTGNSAEIIIASDIEKVVISDSIELPQSALDCPKIAQVKLSSLLAKLIASDGFRHNMDYSDNKDDDAEEYELE